MTGENWKGSFASDDDARAARAGLATARPGRAVEAVAPLGRGNRKRTALVTLDDGERVVLQFAEPDEHLVESEAALLSAIDERTDVPVPQVLASGVEDGVAYLCVTHVEGRDLHERFAELAASEQRAIARSFGRYLADLHASFAFEGYGDVVVREGTLRVEASRTWAEWLDAYGRDALARLPNEFEDLRPDLQRLLADADVDPGAAAHLYPWDLRPGNALVADGEMTAVLDWESPLAAAPALSAAKAEYLVADWYVDDSDPLRRAFREGYETVRAYPSVDPVHRAAAIADSVVDSRGVVTNPRYPELDREASVAFHHRALERIL